MPEMKAVYPGGRAYGRVVFERSDYETDSVATTTACLRSVTSPRLLPASRRG
jgi:hypothetical protein